MLQQRPVMINNDSLSRVGFHIHQLEINVSGTDSQFSALRPEGEKREKKGGASERVLREGGGFSHGHVIMEFN